MPTRVLRALVVALLAGLGALVITAGPASASPRFPGIPDCKDAPTAQMPGTGLPGYLDPGPSTPPPPGDPFATHPTTSVYEQYGYAGLSWHTYDLGCGGGLRDTDATVDTAIGNAFLSGAVWLTSAANGLHAKVSHPHTYMAPLDDVVTAVTHRLRDAIWNPWGGAALVGVAALLLWYSTAGRLSTVTSAAAWAVLVLAVVAGLAQYPSRVASFFDSTVTSSIAAVNTTSAGLARLPATSDPARAQGALLTDRICYDAWVRGEFGSAHTAAAERWAPALYRDRLRHPQAALGFFYSLSAIALETDKETAAWLVDLLIKLGREDDAYDAVALVLPDMEKNDEPADPEPEEEAGPIPPGATPDAPEGSPEVDAEGPVEVGEVRRVALYRDEVPDELDPGRFFQVMCDRVLNNSPINFHTEARARRSAPLT